MASKKRVADEQTELAVGPHVIVNRSIKRTKPGEATRNPAIRKDLREEYPGEEDDAALP